MNFYSFITALIIALLFLYFKVEWLGFVFFVIAIIVLLYNPAKKQTKQAWEDLKKAETTHPEAKYDSYVKGFSKQLAEGVIPPMETEYNTKGAIHKTPQLAKNFFSELKDLLGMK